MSGCILSIAHLGAAEILNPGFPQLRVFCLCITYTPVLPQQQHELPAVFPYF